MSKQEQPAQSPPPADGALGEIDQEWWPEGYEEMDEDPFEDLPNDDEVVEPAGVGPDDEDVAFDAVGPRAAIVSPIAEEGANTPGGTKLPSSSSFIPQGRLAVVRRPPPSPTAADLGAAQAAENEPAGVTTPTNDVPAATASPTNAVQAQLEVESGGEELRPAAQALPGQRGRVATTSDSTPAGLLPSASSSATGGRRGRLGGLAGASDRESGVVRVGTLGELGIDDDEGDDSGSSASHEEDDSDVIDFAAFARGVAALHPVSTPAQRYLALFRIYDVDEDGHLGRGDLAYVLSRTVRFAGASEHDTRRLILSVIDPVLEEASTQPGADYLSYSDFRHAIGQADAEGGGVALRLLLPRL